jgi:hypothetical protein
VRARGIAATVCYAPALVEVMLSRVCRRRRADCAVTVQALETAGRGDDGVVSLETGRRARACDPEGQGAGFPFDCAPADDGPGEVRGPICMDHDAQVLGVRAGEGARECARPVSQIDEQISVGAPECAVPGPVGPNVPFDVSGTEAAAGEVMSAVTIATTAANERTDMRFSLPCQNGRPILFAEPFASNHHLARRHASVGTLL